MPEFLEDPSVLTKDKLKSELVANNVTLPAGEQRKDVYVQLYLQHLTARNRPPPASSSSSSSSLAAGANSKGPPDFSSDEEREPTPVLGSGASSGRGRAAVGRVRLAIHPPLPHLPKLGATEAGVWGARARPPSRRGVPSTPPHPIPVPAVPWSPGRWPGKGGHGEGKDDRCEPPRLGYLAARPRGPARLQDREPV